MSRLFNNFKISLIFLSIIFMAVGFNRQKQQFQDHPKDIFWDMIPNGRSCSYLYAPGLFGSEAIMSRFAQNL